MPLSLGSRVARDTSWGDLAWIQACFGDLSAAAQALARPALHLLTLDVRGTDGRRGRTCRPAFRESERTDMWGLLKRLGSDCWGNHEWISKANTHGLWLECRQCGLESNGVELPPVRYRRTQDGVQEAHRLGGVAPALQRARARGTAITTALRFTARRAAPEPTAVGPARPWDATAASSAVATTDAERRWLQAWRALSPEERALAERMVAAVRLAPRDKVRTEGDDHPRQSRRVG